MALRRTLTRFLRPIGMFPFEMANGIDLFRILGSKLGLKSLQLGSIIDFDLLSFSGKIEVLSTILDTCRNLTSEGGGLPPAPCEGGESTPSVLSKLKTVPWGNVSISKVSTM